MLNLSAVTRKTTDINSPARRTLPRKLTPLLYSFQEDQYIVNQRIPAQFRLLKQETLHLPAVPVYQPQFAQCTPSKYDVMSDQATRFHLRLKNLEWPLTYTPRGRCLVSESIQILQNKTHSDLPNSHTTQKIGRVNKVGYPFLGKLQK